MPDTVLPNTEIAERKPDGFAGGGFIVWQGYEQTEGLSKFRREERYSAWLHAHRRLIGVDPAYATDCRMFYFKLAVCLMLATGLYSCLVSPLLTGTLGLALTTLCGYQEQRRRNERIAHWLAGKH